MQHWNLTSNLRWHTGRRKRKKERNKNIWTGLGEEEGEFSGFLLSCQLLRSFFFSAVLLLYPAGLQLFLCLSFLVLFYSRIFPFKTPMVSSHVGKCHLAERRDTIQFLLPFSFMFFLLLFLPYPLSPHTHTPPPFKNPLTTGCIMQMNGWLA